MLVATVVGAVLVVLVGALFGRHDVEGWRGFALWFAATCMLAFSVLGGGQIVLAPVALLAAWLISARTRLWPEALGVLPGIAVLATLVTLNAG